MARDRRRVRPGAVRAATIVFGIGFALVAASRFGTGAWLHGTIDLVVVAVYFAFARRPFEVWYLGVLERRWGRRTNGSSPS